MPLNKQEQAFFASHRSAALAGMKPGEALLVFSAHHHLRNGDAEYRYRQDSDLYYLCGWRDPDAALLMVAGAEQPFVLFVQPKDKEREVWTGVREGPEGAIEHFGADAAYPIGELRDQLAERLIGVHSLYLRMGQDPRRDALVHGAIAKARRPARDAFQPLPDAFISPSRLLGELRVRKSPAELELLREAARITAQAHLGAMGLAAPGVGEHQLEALIDYTFREQGGNGPGYGSIVGSGPNACILHYVHNDQTLRDGDLVLIDAGCEFRNYTADVTRTFPVSGRFSAAQRQVYELVLRAELAAIDRVRVGGRFSEVHDTAVRVLTEGMVALGLLQGEVDALIEDKSYKRYYMHGTSHWLGLDVHDVGSYIHQGASRAFEPGMVLTVEPGLYIALDDEEAPEVFRGIGVRIEDDVLVTHGEPEVLTAAVPKTIEAVEAACQGR